MKQSIVSPTGMPTANLAINKSRLKLYNKSGSMPTYYLEKGQEFQIELFNPTSNTILAKIHLNGKPITQGGLVIKPGQRVFLERYLDVAKKFLFDTYDVKNTKEIRKAIEENGDFKVEFYKESEPNYSNYYFNGSVCDYNNTGLGLGNYHSGTPKDYLRNSVTGVGGVCTTYYSNTINSSLSSNFTNALYSNEISSSKSPLRKSSLSKKNIETGRVEKGGESNQKLEYIDKTFDFYAFHTIEYKMLPVSQKVNTSEDLNVKRYCSNCGAKHKPSNKFCPSCGTKA